MRSWECATEEALRSNVNNFEGGMNRSKRLRDEIEDVGDLFVQAGANGWTGIEGGYAAGLKFLADVIGQRVIEFSTLADDLRRHNENAFNKLDPLDTESATILTEAEAAFTRYDTAAGLYDTWRGIARRRQQTRDGLPLGKQDTGYEAANTSFWNAIGTRNTHLTNRNLAQDELTGLQTRWDTVREDEDAAHRAFAQGVLAVPRFVSKVEVVVDGETAVSLDMLLDLVDSSALSTGDGRGSAQWQAMLARARDAIGDLTGTDVDERAQLVEDARLLREYRELSEEELLDLIRDALANPDSDPEAARRLARMIDVATRGMTPEERGEYLRQLGEDLAYGGSPYLPIITLFAAGDFPPPDWLIHIMVQLEGSYEDTLLPEATRKLLGELLGIDFDDPNFNEKLLGTVYERLRASEQWDSFVEGIADGSIERPSNQTARDLLLDWFLEDPSRLDGYVNLADSSSSSQLGNLVAMMGGGGNDEGLQALFNAYLVDQLPQGVSITDDTDDSWAHFGDSLGTLQRALDRAGQGSTFDPTAFVKFTVTAVASSVNPAAGTAASGIFALLSGFENDPDYQRLLDEQADDAVNHRNFLIGLTAAMLDPTVRAQLEEHFGDDITADDHEAIHQFIFDGGPLYDEIDGFADTIRDGS